MPDHENQREFTRAPVHVRATLSVEACADVAGEATQLSLGGVFVDCATIGAVGDHCRVILRLEGGTTGVQAEARGNIVRVEPGGVAVKFDEIVGAESLEHLRNLVLYNTLETDQVESEFAEHLGLHRRDSATDA